MFFIIKDTASSNDEMDMVVSFKVFAEGMKGRRDSRDKIMLFKPREDSFRRSFKEEIYKGEITFKEVPEIIRDSKSDMVIKGIREERRGFIYPSISL